MKMSYHFKSSRQDRAANKKFRHKIFLGGAIFLIAILFLLFFPRFTANLVANGSFPFRKAQEILGGAGRNFTSFFSSKLSLSKENNALKKELIDVKYKLADRNALALQNTELLALVGRKSEASTLLAVVLERPPYSPYDTFTIDVGQKQKVKIGDQLVIGEGIIIGKVIETFSSKSRAVLYSSFGQKFQASVGKNHVSVEVEGKGGGNFSIRLPRSVPISIGDVVVASDISPKIFGQIAKIDVTPNDSFQTLYFNSPVNLSQLYYVKVIVSND